jgi:very-short-patch-repair endonuclease
MKEVHNIQRMLERRKELRRNSTLEENILWQRLRNSQLGYKFRRQHSIGGYIADFYCAPLRLIIEIDGDFHNELEQKEYDGFRDGYLKQFNHGVLRFRNAEVRDNTENVLSRIKLYISRQ